MRGLLEPTVRLVNLTRQLDLCIEHTDQPVKCFAETAILHSKKSYQDTEEYQEVWLPILAMEAAEGAVKEGDPIIVHNVKVAMLHQEGRLHGRFRLGVRFCKTRHIRLVRSTKQDEEETQDFLCIRYKTAKQNHSRDVWVGHAVTQNVCVNNDDEVVVNFRLFHYNIDPPFETMEENNEDGVACTVELLPKMLPDR